MIYLLLIAVCFLSLISIVLVENQWKLSIADPARTNEFAPPICLNAADMPSLSKLASSSHYIYISPSALYI